MSAPLPEQEVSHDRLVLEGILQLQKQGLSLRKIGEQLRLCPERVHTLIKLWLERKL